MSSFIGVVFITLIIYWIYFRKIKTYDQVVSRGVFLEILGLKNKGIKLYTDALNRMNLSEKETRNLHYILGIIYARQRCYKKATTYFDRALINYKENFRYKKEFNLVIQSYINSANREGAKEVLLYF